MFLFLISNVKKIEKISKTAVPVAFACLPGVKSTLEGSAHDG